MSWIRSMAAVGLPCMAAVAWCMLYLPSSWAFHRDPLQITRGAWAAAGNLLITLEPFSQSLPGALLSGLSPLVLLALALSLAIVGQRLIAYGVLVVTAITGLSVLLYIVPVIRSRMQPYTPQSRDPFANGPLAQFLDPLAQIVQLFPRAVLDIGMEFTGSVVLGLGALIATALLRRHLFTEPIRHGLALRRNGDEGWMPRVLAKRLVAPGLPLGRWQGLLLRYPHQDPTRTFYQGHHVVIAATRSGKGVGAVVPSILDHDGPVTAIDIKGENLAITRRERETKGYQVLALNPFSVLEPSRTGLNPLDFIRPEQVSEDCAMIAVALIREESSDAGAHLMRLGRDLVAAAIEVVHTHADPADRHLIAVFDLLTGPGADTAFKAWAANPTLCGGRPARAVSSFQGNDTKERNLVISTVRANLGFAGGDRMQSFLKTSGLKPEHILSGKTDIFVVVPLEQVEAQRNFLRLVTALVVNSILGSARRKLAANMLMVLDEFPVLGPMAQIKDLFTIGAGSNITLLTIAQDLARLRDVWGHNGAQSLLAQSATVRIMGLGAGDIDTARWVSELLPKVPVRREGRSYAGDRMASDRVNYSETDRPLLTPDELLTMSGRQLLCLFRGQKPLVLDKITYHQDRVYRNRSDHNPYAD